MRRLLAIAILIMLSGCVNEAKISYDPATGIVTYERKGDQELIDVSIVLADGTGIDIGKQKSDIAQALQLIDKLLPFLPLP